MTANRTTVVPGKYNVLLPYRLRDCHRFMNVMHRKYSLGSALSDRCSRYFICKRVFVLVLIKMLICFIVIAIVIFIADCENCLVSCPFDGSSANTCHCPKSHNSTKGEYQTKTTSVSRVPLWQYPCRFNSVNVRCVYLTVLSKFSHTLCLKRIQQMSWFPKEKLKISVRICNATYLVL